MKINEMNFYEWNIGMAATIPSNQGYGFNGWIIDEIIKDEPDCIVLTEFVVSRGIDYAISKLEEKGYHWFISSSTKSNGILIALKKREFDFSDTFCYTGSTDTVITNDMLLGIDLPNFYEIRIKSNGKLLSIIGVRVRKGLTNEKTNFTKNQFTTLDNYLSNLTHDVICLGDFNAYWADRWFTKKNYMLPKTAARGYSLHTPIYNISDGYSYVQTEGAKTQLDHLITNMKSKKIESTYYWGFINVSRYGHGVCADSANKPKGLPDHAILKVSIKDIPD